MGGVKKYSPPRETIKSSRSAVSSVCSMRVQGLSSLHRDGPIPVSEIEPLDVSGRVLSVSVGLEVAYDGVRALYE